MRHWLVTIGLCGALVWSNLAPTTVDVTTNVEEIHVREDGLREIDCVVPHCEKPNCTDNVVVYFTTNDLGFSVGQNHIVTVNYGNDYEIIAVDGKELPEEWR